MAIAVAPAAAQPDFPSWFHFETYRDETGEHRYAVYVPQSYQGRRPGGGAANSRGDGAEAQRPWPIMLFLHGAGERGSDGYRQLMVGLGPVLRRRADFPFIVVFPQAEDVGSRYLTGWLAGSPDARRALKILEKVEQEYDVAASQRVLCGWSMGGYGAWSIAAAHPEMWSAVLPISGGGEPDALGGLARANTPVWAIHGAEDSLIRPEQSRLMVGALRQLEGNVHYSELPGLTHDVAPIVFRNEAVARWLLDPKAVDVEDVDWDAATAAAARRRNEVGDFIPTAVAHRVIGVRLGNTALETLAEGIPQAIPPDALAGRLDDITRTFGEGSQGVQVRFSGISYRVEVTGARIAAVSSGRFRVSFALSPVTLRFAHTEISGRPVQAEAGAFQIVLGTQRPVWLDLEVRPEALEGKVRLVPLRRQFRVADDNWYVSPPAEVSVTRGELPPEHIVTGIVGGMYLNRDTIEEHVRGVVPGLLRTIEDRLGRIDTAHLTGALWPLPVLAPQLRLRPAAIRTDREGVSVLLDVLVGFPSVLRPPPVLQQLPVDPLSFEQIGDSRELNVFAQLGLVGALSSVAVEQGRAYINVLDIPEPSFAGLVDPEFVRSILPDVPGEVTEFRAIVALVEPFRVELLNADAQTSTLRLSTGGLQLSFHGRPASSDSWQPLGVFGMDVEQILLVTETGGPHRPGGLRVQWEEGSEVSARATVGQSTPAQLNRLEREFRADWTAWATSQPQTVTRIPDIEAGRATLFWEDLVWTRHPRAGETVELRFGTPSTAVVNESNRAMLYEVRSATCGWSGPYVLQPGESHRYDVGYELKWRRFAVEQPARQVYTVAPGSTLTLGPRAQVHVATDGQ